MSLPRNTLVSVKACNLTYCTSVPGGGSVAEWVCAGREFRRSRVQVPL